MRTVKITRVERVWCAHCETSVRVWVSLRPWYARTWVTPTGQCPECKVHIRYTPPRVEAVIWGSRRDAYSVVREIGTGCGTREAVGSCVELNAHGCRRTLR